MTLCPCSSNLDWEQCCEPFLLGGAQPATAEALMRSRYTAYTRADMTYIKETTQPEQRHSFDWDYLKRWAKDSTWLGLEILTVEAGEEADDHGYVTFKASYKLGGGSFTHCEHSRFVKENGRWYFVEGREPTVDPKMRKVGRNDLCPCGSGKKYKKCHG